MAPFFGNSVACRIAEAHEIKHSTLVLGDWRAAQRIEFYIGRNGEEGGEQIEVPPGLGARRGGSGRRAAARAQRGGSAARAAGSSSGELLAAERGAGAGSEAGSEAGSDGSAAGERSVVSGRGAFKVWVINTHLAHDEHDKRQSQVGPAELLGLAAW